MFFDFQQNCKMHHGSLRSLVKPLLKKVLSEALPLPAECMKYIQICSYEYQFRFMMERSEKACTVQQFSKAFFQLDSALTNPFVYMKGEKKLREVQKFTKESENVIEQLQRTGEEFTEPIEELKEKMDLRRIEVERIKEGNDNLKFAQELAFMTKNQIDLGKCTVSKIKYEATLAYLEKEASLTQLEKLCQFKLSSFLTNDIAKLYKRAHQIFHHKLFADQKSQINTSYFQNEELFKELRESPESWALFEKRREEYWQFL